MSSDRRARPSRFLPVAALAGAVVGHWITYLIAFPRAQVRGNALAHTGHGYWFAAIDLAIACAALAVAGTIYEHVRRALGHATRARSGDRVRNIALRLAGLQTALFLAQEVLERLRVGAPLSSLAHGDLLLIGIGIQVAVAFGVALLLALLGRTAAAIALAIAGAPRPATYERTFPEPVTTPHTRLAAAPLGPRAPPGSPLPLAA